jgi:hypothetical protein
MQTKKPTALPHARAHMPTGHSQQHQISREKSLSSAINSLGESTHLTASKDFLQKVGRYLKADKKRDRKRTVL